MTEHEIFEKLKEALDYQYMYDSFEYSEERKEVDNLEDYLRIIKQEREKEKDFEDAIIITYAACVGIRIICIQYRVFVRSVSLVGHPHFRYIVFLLSKSSSRKHKK